MPANPCLKGPRGASVKWTPVPNEPGTGVDVITMLTGDKFRFRFRKCPKEAAGTLYMPQTGSWVCGIRCEDGEYIDVIEVHRAKRRRGVLAALRRTRGMNRYLYVFR